MKILWCWRCQAEIPMLNDDEFRQVMTLRGTGRGDLWGREFGPVLQEYERITGVRAANIGAFYHHVESLYGPPCQTCGKPLRTPRARFCGACGASVRANER